MNPLATIIVLVNSGQDDYLEETIKSALQQTYREFILYICCSDSTTQALKSVESYGDEYPIVCINSHTEDSALSSAIEATKTQYFGWLNSGDTLRPNALEEAVKAIHNNPEIGAVYTNQSAIDENGSLEDNAEVFNVQYSEEKLLTDFIVTQFRLIRRSVYKKSSGINNRLPYCKAYDLILKISEISDFIHLEKPLYCYRKLRRSRSSKEQIGRILWAKEVADQALQRRSMSSEYELAVELLPQCYLIDKVLSDAENRQ